MLIERIKAWWQAGQPDRTPLSDPHLVAADAARARQWFGSGAEAAARAWHAQGAATTGLGPRHWLDVAEWLRRHPAPPQRASGLVFASVGNPWRARLDDLGLE